MHILNRPPVGKRELDFKWQLLINLANILPHFDVTWGQEEKTLWWESMRSIIAAGINLCRLNDDLEMYERDRKQQLSTPCRHVEDYRE